MKPKHQEISRDLRQEVLAGKFGSGGRMPSEAQLVKRFGASRPTIARALRTLQDEGLVVRRAGSGTFVQESAGPHVAGTRTLALLIPDLQNAAIFQQIAGEIAGLARVREYSVIWGGSEQPVLDTDVSLGHGEALCDQFIEQRVDGVFFTPYELVKGQTEANRRMAQKLHDAGIPVVLIDRDLVPFPQRGPYDVIGVDNLCGGYELGKHLIKLGCRSICYVFAKRSAPTIDARIAGLRTAIVEQGLPWSADRVFKGDVTAPLFLRKVLAQGLPDALVGGNDHTAALLLQNLAKMGREVPREIRVVGFDDAEFAPLVSPPLTTMQQPCREIALSALGAMFERLATPTLPARHISIAPRLIIRDSCGAYV